MSRDSVRVTSRCCRRVPNWLIQPHSSPGFDYLHLPVCHPVAVDPHSVEGPVLRVPGGAPHQPMFVLSMCADEVALSLLERLPDGEILQINSCRNDVSLPELVVAYCWPWSRRSPPAPGRWPSGSCWARFPEPRLFSWHWPRLLLPGTEARCSRPPLPPRPPSTHTPWSGPAPG